MESSRTGLHQENCNAQNCGCNATFCILRFNAFKLISFTSSGIYMWLWLSDALKYLFEEDGTHKMLKSAQICGSRCRFVDHFLTTIACI